MSKNVILFAQEDYGVLGLQLRCRICSVFFAHPLYDIFIIAGSSILSSRRASCDGDLQLCLLYTKTPQSLKSLLSPFNIFQGVA